MNLSTARSQKRGKEVGVRKVVGSRRSHLVHQFLMESLLVVCMGFVLAILIVQVAMPLFNLVAEKAIHIDWLNPALWTTMIVLIVGIALLAGGYPALFLSRFNPATVLKGTYAGGSHTSWPRKVLVVVQFAVSIVLTIGTVVVYQQIQYASRRPLGYALNGLITVPITTEEVRKSYSAFKNELLSTHLIADVSASETTVLNMWWSDWGFQWEGKDPNMQDNIFRGAVDFEFGNTVGWKIKEGRDFSRALTTDSSAMILNEAAVKYMGFKNPIGEVVQAYGRSFTVIGVVEDMVTQSLYSPHQQTVFIIDPFNRASFINIKIDPQSAPADAITSVNRIFMKHNPNTPFEYRFADDEFAEKFAFEARVGRLVGIFSALALFISLLGLFGLSAYVAERRTKEIGIRKVMGATVVRLWQLLAKDFVILIAFSCAIAVPLGYLLMKNWLASYDYRTNISWWVLLLTCVGALFVTAVTVSVQVLKAALINPVKSLRSE